MGVPIEKDQVAYRFSPVSMTDGKIEWLYRVSKEEKKRLQDDIVAKLLNSWSRWTLVLISSRTAEG